MKIIKDLYFWLLVVKLGAAPPVGYEHLVPKDKGITETTSVKNSSSTNETEIPNNKIKLPAKAYLFVVIVFAVVLMVLIGVMWWSQGKYPVRKTVHYSLLTGSCEVIEICTDIPFGSYPDTISSCFDMPCSVPTATLTPPTPVPPTPVAYYVTSECCETLRLIDIGIISGSGILIAGLFVRIRKLRQHISKISRHLNLENK